MSNKTEISNKVLRYTECSNIYATHDTLRADDATRDRCALGEINHELVWATNMVGVEKRRMQKAWTNDSIRDYDKARNKLITWVAIVERYLEGLRAERLARTSDLSLLAAYERAEMLDTMLREQGCAGGGFDIADVCDALGVEYRWEEFCDIVDDVEFEGATARYDETAHYRCEG